LKRLAERQVFLFATETLYSGLVPRASVPAERIENKFRWQKNCKNRV
jgi:hypothetical protein